MNNNIRSITRSSLTKIEFFRKADGAKKMVHSKTESFHVQYTRICQKAPYHMLFSCRDPAFCKLSRKNT